MTLHRLKIAPTYFDAVANGTKPFEVRKNDRNYQVGDVLELLEYVAFADKYTGRVTYGVVTYVLPHMAMPEAITPGYVVLGLTGPQFQQPPVGADRAAEPIGAAS